MGLEIFKRTKDNPLILYRSWYGRLREMRGPIKTEDDAEGLLFLQKNGDLFPIWKPGCATNAGCIGSTCQLIPAKTCSCGIYGTSNYLYLLHAYNYNVFGRVALWGRIIRNDKEGLIYRAQHAKPYEFFWRESNRDLVIKMALMYGVPIVQEPDSQMFEDNGVWRFLSHISSPRSTMDSAVPSEGTGPGSIPGAGSKNIFTSTVDNLAPA